jgi:pimeloyl-ACP methyl ester carboxylesterase
VPFAAVGDVTLFYTDDGSGDPPLLFVHGYSCDGHDWSWQLPNFVAHHRVIVVDNRGHGRSSVPDSGYDHLSFAGDLANLLDHLACGPVVAVGHSLGGVIASTLAVERPDLVQAIVSIDPGYLVSDELSGGLASLIEALDSSDPVPIAQATLGGTYTAASSPALRTWHMRRIAGTPVHVLRQTLKNLLEGMALESVSAPYLARRTCPVLALYADPARAVVEANLLTDSRSRVVSFEGSGHWLHQERPAEVNHIIDTWLANLADS